MNIQLYTLAKKTNSTMRPSGTGRVVGIQLKSPCSILNPVLEGATYYPENYCYIPDWRRYYFITEKTYINGAWEYELDCDYLATWKTEIGATVMFMLRASASYNGDLVDKYYPLLGTSFTEDSLFGDKVPFSNGVFVISVIGNNSNSGAQILYQLTPAQFQTFLDELLVNASGVNWGNLDDGVKLSVMNPTQYITACRWFPKAFEVISDAQDNPITSVIKAGLWSSTTPAQIVSAGNYAARETYSVVLKKHPQASTLGNNMNLSPMTRYVLELGCFGVHDLDTSLLYNCNYLDIYIYADPFTGIGKARVMGRYQVSGNDYRKLIACLDGKYGVDIPLAQAGGFDAGSFTTASAGAWLGRALNVMTVAGGWKHGEENIQTLIGSADESMNGVKYATSSVGQVLVHNMDKHLYSYFQERIVGDNTNNGRPYMRTSAPSILGGFMVAQKGLVELPASDEEMKTVNGYMESGFYYE